MFLQGKEKIRIAKTLRLAMRRQGLQKLYVQKRSYTKAVQLLYNYVFVRNKFLHNVLIQTKTLAMHTNIVTCLSL